MRNAIVTTGLVVIAGEVTTNAVVDINVVARETVKRIGYDSSEIGFDYPDLRRDGELGQTPSPDITRA